MHNQWWQWKTGCNGTYMMVRQWSATENIVTTQLWNSCWNYGLQWQIFVLSFKTTHNFNKHHSILISTNHYVVCTWMGSYNIQVLYLAYYDCTYIYKNSAQTFRKFCAVFLLTLCAFLLILCKIPAAQYIVKICKKIRQLSFAFNNKRTAMFCFILFYEKQNMTYQNGDWRKQVSRQKGANLCTRWIGKGKTVRVKSLNSVRIWSHLLFLFGMPDSAAGCQCCAKFCAHRIQEFCKKVK